MPRPREVEFGINSPVKTVDYHGYHTNGPSTEDEFRHPHFRRTLEDINVLDDQSRADIESGKLGSMIWKDFKSNFTVVTVPAIFTNALWRGMNIGGVAVQDSPAMVIVETTAYIATLVWILCSLVDAIRQLYLAGWSFSEYRATDGPRASFNLGWKFFMGVIGWTVGYEIAAGTHMFYAGTNTAVEFVTHAIGAAIGEFFGLLVACELTHISEFIITGKLSTHPPTGSLGVATKGILEGAVWSLIGDANIYQHWGSNVGSGLADSFILGIAAALGFSVMGIFTSIMGYMFIHRQLRLNH